MKTKDLVFRSGMLLVFWINAWSVLAQKNALENWKAQASRVTIYRDPWGIPHIYGKTDADAVFGLLYAQCEDDFKRIEENYLEKLGRKSEWYGDSLIFEDLYNRILLDSNDAKLDYQNAPPWLKKLCDAFADGINYFLYKTPTVKPRLLKHFEPWWPLLWTDGGINAINTGGAQVAELAAFYQNRETATFPFNSSELPEPSGSNGFAFSPQKTASGKACLYINPHVDLYFRPEVHMVSEEGLNAYGAVTWGQFFVYQGFNSFCGWMHTTGYSDVADLYQESIDTVEGSYLYEKERKPLIKTPISISYRNGLNQQSRQFMVYSTHHGPIVAIRDQRWLSLKSHNRHLNGLIQSWRRTKAKSFAEFNEIMALRENTSNNTVYADAAGNISYWHGNFIPRRNPLYNWSQPVEGTTKATEWQGLHDVSETIVIQNPGSGYIQNCNSSPFTASGVSSPIAKNYPRYMANDAENFRGLNAVAQFSNAQHLTLDQIIEKAYNRKLPFFEWSIPILVNAWQRRGYTPDSLALDMQAAIDTLAQWDFTSANRSIATTLAIEWGQLIIPNILRQPVSDSGNIGLVEQTRAFLVQASPTQLLGPLQIAIQQLKQRYGSWQAPWGQINRYQRLTGNIKETYNDEKPSLAIPFASSVFGALPNYTSVQMPGTRNRYGIKGNSFICVVEFGAKLRAKSLLAGGNSGNIRSPFFETQAKLYADGKFKDVLFYKSDVVKAARKIYKP